MTRNKIDLPPRNWAVLAVFVLTAVASVTLVPWYGFTHGFSAWAWVLAVVFLYLNGIGIGSGYHRLWSHRTYQAHWSLRLFLALWGGQALQNSVLIWSARHRVHHRHVDDNERDPYSIGRGFWFAHIGWMLRDYPSGKIDYSLVKDLQRDPIVAWQHRWYWPMTIFMNAGLPLLLGWMLGDLWGVFLLAGVLRLVVNHHVTFFINSLAHMWGKRPYSDEHSAKDNWFLSILTYGEGYHNFHHTFQSDYRNGVRWWQFDLNKWFISLCNGLGLAYNLKRVPRFKILRARLAMEFKRARTQLETGKNNATWISRLEHEYAEFKSTVKDWQGLQLEKVEAQRLHLLNRWEATSFRTRLKSLEYGLKMQRKRLALIAIQAGI